MKSAAQVDNRASASSDFPRGLALLRDPLLNKTYDLNSPQNVPKVN